MVLVTLRSTTQPIEATGSRDAWAAGVYLITRRAAAVVAVPH
jgi:hypothetical protein